MRMQFHLAASSAGILLAASGIHAQTPPIASPVGERIAVRVADRGPIPLGAEPFTSILDVDAARLEAFALNGGGIVIGFPFGPHLDADLELVPVEPFEEDATIDIVRRASKGRPLVEAVFARDLLVGSAFLAGSVVGQPGSHVFLASSAAGVFGYAQLDDQLFIVSSGPAGSGQPIASYDFTNLPEGLIELPEWACQTIAPDGVVGGALADGGVAGDASCRQIRIAYESDYEFATRFALDADAATGYVATLSSAMTTIFSRDFGARLSASYLRLWLEPADPWTANSTTAQLGEFRTNWNTFMTSVPRDAAHFLSGRSLGGGVAYLPGLCTTYAYALSANLSGSFPTPLVDNDAQNWDPFVVAHELGHNFGAPHTHDAASYDPVIDGCGLSPQDCGSASAGTVMSYCHLCAGGIANIRLGFHPRTITTVTGYLDGAACDYTASARPPVTVADAASAWSTVARTIDILANDVEFNCENFTLDAVQSPTPGGATVVVVPGAGSGGLDAISYTNATSFTGVDTFTYTIRDASNQTITGSVRVTVTGLRAPENPIGSTGGLDARYYALSSPSALPDFLTLTPYLTGVASAVNYPSTTGSFAGSGLSDNVGAVFSGWVLVPSDGVWTFYAGSDDGSRLKIGDTEVVSHDGLHGFTERSGEIGLRAGRHAFRVEFFERTGGAGLIASWQGPGVAKGVIPSANLWRGGATVPADYNGDGQVDAIDLSTLLAAWNTVNSTVDLSGDGVVNAVDITFFFSYWTG